MSIIAPTIQICRQRSSKTHNECSDFSVKCERSKEKYAKNFFITEMEHLIQWGRICDLYNLRFGNFRKKMKSFHVTKIEWLRKLSDGEWRYQSKMNANDMLSFVKKKVRLVCECRKWIHMFYIKSSRDKMLFPKSRHLIQFNVKLCAHGVDYFYIEWRYKVHS